MKIELNKKGMTRYCQPNELELMKSAGWTEANKSMPTTIQPEDVIVLKAPAKSKGADKSLDNANQQGD